MTVRETAPVIVCSDLSLYSDAAIRAAAAWARRIECSLDIVHVGPHALFRTPQKAHVTDALIARLESLIETLEVPSRIVMRQGDVPEEVSRYAAEKGSPLVVVGASLKGTAARVVLGSAADQIVRRAPCPVLVVRASAARGAVLAATDFSPAAAAAVDAGAAEARSRRAPLVLMHSVYEPDPLAALGPAVIGPPAVSDEEQSVRQAAAERLLRTLLESSGAPGEVHVSAGEPGRSVVAAAEISGAELVVVATHGRTGVARAALGSVAEYVVRHAPCSVLVMRRAG